MKAIEEHGRSQTDRPSPVYRPNGACRQDLGWR
jgi:hypothetical protein